MEITLLEKLKNAERETQKIEEIFSVGPQYGYTASANDKKIGPRFLRITDIQGNVVDWETVPFCEISSAEKSKYLLQKEDLVFARTGATTGMSYFVNSDLSEEAVFASYLIRLRFDKNKCDPRLLKYFFQSKNYWGQVRGSLSGSAQPGINAVTLSQLLVNLPDVPTQRKIADILDVYDAKIENNNSIIKNLEAIGQNVFNEWFVKFRFPGHEKARFVDSEMGKIPQNWRIEKITNVSKVTLGGTPSREKPEYWSGDIPWINSGEVNKLRVVSATEFITNIGLKNSNARLMNAGTTLIAITGATLGQVSRLEIDSTANQSVVGIFDDRNLLNEYIYLYIKSNILDLISGASGGAQQHINKQMVEEYQILIPENKILAHFTEMVVPMFSQITESLFENITLQKTRDRLLEKLI